MPNGWLVNKIMRVEEERIGLRIKVVEESGISMGWAPSRPCLTSPGVSALPDCHMNSAGPSHLRAGANYSGVCNICERRYGGETGFSSHARIELKQIRAL